MREPIKNERVTDDRDGDIKAIAPEREHPADNQRHTNDYFYEEILIHETFDPNGPTFKDCIVRVVMV
jgi:hypothetical protein